MKKETRKAADREEGDLLPEYRFDYSKSKPNRFANRPKLGRVRSVVLEPDVAKVFHSSDEVNAFLRSAINTMPPRDAETEHPKKRAS